MNKRRKRRRGVYISPVMLLSAAAVLALAAAIVLLPGRGGGDVLPPEESAAPSAQPTQPDQSTQPTQPAQPPATATLSDGTVCDLTQLGEDAVYTGSLVLVNNWTCYHFPEEEELVNVFEQKNGQYIVARTDILLRQEAMDALNRMLSDFRAQGGSRTVNVVAGHRTAEFQQHLFDQSAARNGLDHAKQFVAQPGGSEHHTGLVVDLSVMLSDGSSRDYDGTGEYAWINENCHNYGYIVRYAADKASLTGIADEPWHFRWLGVPHATQAVKEGLCMEEYIDYLKDFTVEEPLTISCADGAYEVWYAAGTEVYLPRSGEYEVSGNNVDGVIVTRRIG